MNVNILFIRIPVKTFACRLLVPHNRIEKLTLFSAFISSNTAVTPGGFLRFTTTEYTYCLQPLTAVGCSVGRRLRINLY